MPSQKADPSEESVVGSIASDSIVVTTSRSPDDVSQQHARAIASEIGCVFQPRSRCPLETLCEGAECVHAIVVTHSEVRLVSPEGSFWFHPNMARARIESTLRGEIDRLAAFVALKEGDSFLDMTCGLGADAITAAHVVGEAGRVVAVERSEVLSTIVRHGMQIYKHRTKEVESAMRRVEVVSADSVRFLENEPDRSWDVIYFDPMFEKTVQKSQGIDGVRTLAWSGSTTRPQVQDALRVARRCVAMKDRAPGEKLRELGFANISDRGRVCYGRMDV
jgi:16S rRNA (guanine1516-N2)-methyltransferase